MTADALCECDWKDCGHKGRAYLAADHVSVRTSPELCMACLFCCEAEREELDDLTPEWTI